MTTNALLLAAAALAAVLGLIWLAQRAARAGFLPTRLIAPTVDGQLAIVQIQALDPRRRLLLVRCVDRHVLLMTGGPQDLVVGWIDPERQS